MNGATDKPALMPWPRYQHVVFDCDSTLSRIEGIDELASHPDTRQAIADLTNAAMDGGVSLQEVYAERLNILSPTRGAVRALKSRYKKHLVEDAAEVIQVLQELGHEIYIVSGGLLDPVKEFGMSLGVKRDHIRAVELEFNHLSDDWWANNPWQERYLAYRQSALAESDGKARIIDELLAGKSGRSLLIGDGVSDLLAAGKVDLFVGYCGGVKRRKVAAEAPVIIESESLSPLLYLSGPGKRLEQISAAHLPLVEKASKLIDGNALHFNQSMLAQKFKTLPPNQSAKQSADTHSLF